MLGSLIALFAATSRRSAERGELALELFVNAHRSQTRRALSAEPDAVLRWSGDTAPSALSRRVEVVVPMTTPSRRVKATPHYAHAVLSWRGPSSLENRTVIARQSVPLTEFWWVREGGSRKQRLHYHPLLRLVHVEEPPLSRSVTVPTLWRPLLDRCLVFVRQSLRYLAYDNRRGLGMAQTCTARATAAREKTKPSPLRLGTLAELAPLWRASNESRGRALLVDTFWALESDLVAIADDATSYTLHVDVASVSALKYSLQVATTDAFEMLGTGKDQLESVKEIWRTLLRRGSVHCSTFAAAGFVTIVVPPVTVLTDMMIFHYMQTDIPSSSALAGVSVLSLALDLAWNGGEVIAALIRGTDVAADAAADAGDAAEESSASTGASATQVHTIEALSVVSRGWMVLSIAALASVWKLVRAGARFEGRLYVHEPISLGCGCTVPNLRIRAARIEGAHLRFALDLAARARLTRVCFFLRFTLSFHLRRSTKSAQVVPPH